MNTEYIKKLEEQEKEIYDLKQRLNVLEKAVFVKNSRNAGRMPKCDEEIKNQIINRYLEVNSSRKVAEEFKISKSTVLNIIHENTK